MATSAQSPNDFNNMRRYPTYVMSDDIRSRLPPANADFPPSQPPPLNPPLAQEPALQPSGSRRAWWNSGFFPVFWTIASILSLAVNVVLCLLVLGLLSVRGAVTDTVNGQSTSLIGGLYDNFVKMDQATISRTIPVDAKIPLDLTVPVQTRTTILLSEPTVIHSPRVYIQTGGLTLNAPALVTLPANQPLVVDLNFTLPVRTTVPVHIDVPVSIPLRETELHGPFVGLQGVAANMWCLVHPNAPLNSTQTCPPLGLKILGINIR